MPRSPKRAVTVSSPSWHTATLLHSLTSNSSAIHSSFHSQLAWIFYSRAFSFHLTKGFASQAKLQCVEAFMATNTQQTLNAKPWCCSHNRRDEKLGVFFVFLVCWFCRAFNQHHESTGMFVTVTHRRYLWLHHFLSWPISSPPLYKIDWSISGFFSFSFCVCVCVL